MGVVGIWMNVQTTAQRNICDISSIQKKEDGSQNAALRHAAGDNRLGRHVTGEADSLRAIPDEQLNPVDDWSTNSERWL